MASSNAIEDSGGPATATRSRRRQRPKTSESVAQPKAKRQRLPLTEQTFAQPEVQQTQEMSEVKSEDKVAKLNQRNAGSDVENQRRLSTPQAQMSNQFAVRRESSVRTAKKPKHGDRAANKGDGSLLLTSTSAYNVSRLPALPDKIRSDWSANQHADISTLGYALSLTQTHALVWPYASTSQSPETFTFTLPATSKPNDPLPVGCLVSPSAASSEPGLVVVMAGSGRVVYWETISSAATFAFINKDRSGVEGTVPGMSTGEKVIAMTGAEPAGFVLTFNTGRLAFLNVRDSYGRPAVSVQFLRAGLAASSSGIFGSIRHAFSHLSLRGDVAAVRADRSSRVGERNIVALSKKARLQTWRLHRSGHYESLGELDAKDTIVAAIQEFDSTSRDFSAESFEALDFTYVPQGLDSKYSELTRLSAAVSADDPLIQHLLVLVSFTNRLTARYAMVEVVLADHECRVGMIRPLTSYSTPIIQPSDSQLARPRIYLPRPALVAFAVFDRAAVIASVADTPDSPDSQLQIDNHILPASFEDVIDFREDGHDILGSGIEELPAASQNHEENRVQRQRSKNPAAILLVRGAGAVRIITTDVDKLASEHAPRVSAKGKLEQAVFFGMKADNPLVFDAKSEIKFSKDELASAALAVSHEILTSTTTHLASLPPSMEDNLRARSNAMERLMKHLKAIDADLDRETRWELLFNAEKMHVAALLWRQHESFIAARPANDKTSLIKSVVEAINETQKSNPSVQSGEVDPIRHWFINDAHSMSLLVAWAYELIKTFYKEKMLNDAKLTVMIHEAIQINTCAHMGAMDFRKHSLNLYGLGGEELQNGILKNGYERLPEPWTSQTYLANNVKRLVDLSMTWCINNPRTGKAKSASEPDPKTVAKIFDELPLLVEVMLNTAREYASWGKTQPDEKLKTTAQNFGQVYNEERYNKSTQLAEMGKWEEGARIAEKHKSLDALAEILLDHVDYLENALGKADISPVESQGLKHTRSAKKTKLEDCFTEYGEAFAFPVYEHLLKNHGVDAMLMFDLDKLGFKTKFLHSQPALARISWIHDVQQENDIATAADTLLELALDKEQQVWNKKIELSLGKLALLAEQGNKKPLNDFRVNADEAKKAEKLKQVDQELVAIKIQQQLYDVVSQSTYAAVDETAALNFAMEQHGANIPRRQKALHTVFEDGMKRLLKHEALDAMTLIDLLTMVYLEQDIRHQLYNPFWLALKVADSVCHSDEVKEAKRMIWRRVFIRDEWAKLNDTKDKGDRAVVEGLADTELFDLLVSCIQRQDASAPFSPMSPTEAIGAFTDEPDRRFREFGDASFKTKFADAMRWEDKQLQSSIEKHRLVKWVQAAFEEAKTAVQLELDEVTMRGAGVRGGGSGGDEMEIS